MFNFFTTNMSRRTKKQIKRGILEALADGEKKSINEISSTSGINRATVRRYLKALERKLVVACVYNSKQCKLYQLIQKKQFVRCQRCRAKVVIPE